MKLKIRWPQIVDIILYHRYMLRKQTLFILKIRYNIKLEICGIN